MIAAIDVGKLFELVWAAALAGIAVGVTFSLVIIGVARAEDCRRNRRSGSATAYAALSVVVRARVPRHRGLRDHRHHGQVTGASRSPRASARTIRA